MQRTGFPATMLTGLLALYAGPSPAIEVDNLDGFEQHFGRYAPGGDCAKQPRIAIDREGFSFEAGPALPKATRADYAASFRGNFYQGISLTFFDLDVSTMKQIQSDLYLKEKMLRIISEKARARSRRPLAR